MKTKNLSFILASVFTILVTLAGVGIVAAAIYKTVLIEVSDAQGQLQEVEFPLAPKKIICLNYDSVDILDKLGMGDRIVGMIKDETAPKHLQRYIEDSSIMPVGTMKAPNLEAMVELKPHVILSSGRTGKMYDEFTKIAPTMMVAVDATDGFYQGVKRLAVKHGILLDKEKDVQKYLANIEQKMERIRKSTAKRGAIQAIFVGENLHILGGKAIEGKDGGKVLITDLGFDNMAEDFDRSNKDVTSYDYILEKNPEFIFVLDKNTAVNNGKELAKDVLPKQEKLMQTTAMKEGKLIFLAPENTWYLNNGGLTAMETMLTNFTSLPKKTEPKDQEKEPAKAEEKKTSDDTSLQSSK